MLTKRIHNFWFGEVPLTRLALFRILVLGLAMMDLLATSGSVIRHAELVSSGQYAPWSPIFLFEVLGLEELGVEGVRALVIAYWACLGLAMVGLFSRTTCLLAALLFLYWTGLVYSAGKAHHDKVAIAFALLALPLAPVGARLSLDAVVARYRRIRRGESPFAIPRMDAFAGVPLRLTQVTLVLGYCFAGSTKLAVSGPGWANGYTLMAIMMEHNNSLSLFFSQNVLACKVLGTMTLALQVTTPIVLFWPKARWVYLPALVSFHLGTWMTMDTGAYMTLWFLLISFLPLERVPRWALSRPRLRLLVAGVPTALVLYIFSLYFSGWVALLLLPVASGLVLLAMGRAPIAVVYDGHCGLCRRTAGMLAAADWCGALTFHDLSDWAATSARFPQLDERACIADMHAVLAGGEARPGFAAYRAIAWRLPLTAPLAWVLAVPPVRAAGEAVYRRVADNRARKACGSNRGA